MKRAPTAIERESAFLLLVLQSGIGLVSAAGPVVLSLGGSPGNALLAVLTVLLAAAELVLAILFLRGSRRAASWLAGYQALCLWGAGLALSAHLGADNHFAPLVTNLVIPTLLLVLLLRSRERSADAGADQVDDPVEQPAHAAVDAAGRGLVQVQL
ncbi:MAG TPA: hypothetical protein VIO86_07755 [Candidatus Dormibacteraeota bacterium]|jgi:hypothetical protein